MNLKELETDMNEILASLEATAETIKELKMLVNKNERVGLEIEATIESTVEGIYLLVNQVRREFEILRERIEPSS